MVVDTADTDVLIVGAGPAGLTAANLLSLYGVRSVLIERNITTSEVPKAIMVDDEFFRTLNSLGVADELKEHCAYSVGVHFLSTLGFALARVPGFQTANHFPNRSATAQPMLERLLLARVTQRRESTILFEHELTGLDEKSDFVVAQVNGPAGAKVEFAARFVIGCDGASSAVRRLLGIEFEGTTATDQPHIVVDVADDPDGSPFSRFHCWPSRPMNSVPAPYHGRRYEFMLLPGEDPKDMLTDAALTQLFAPHRDFATVKIIRRAVYTFHARLARTMRRGRVFLAGDAGHLMPPFGAQGMNAGARDVTNLCWKLARVVAGDASDRLLDSYDVERRAHVAAVIDLSVRIGRLTNITSRPLALIRDLAFGVAALFPSVRRYFETMRYMPRPVLRSELILVGEVSADCLGRPVPLPLVMGSDRRIRLLDEDLGQGFALIHVDPASLDDVVGSRSSLEAQTVAVMRAGAKLSPPQGVIAVSVMDGRFDPILAAHRGQVLIVRPDRYVAAAVPLDELDHAVAILVKSMGVAASVAHIPVPQPEITNVV